MAFGPSLDFTPPPLQGTLDFTPPPLQGSPVAVKKLPDRNQKGWLLISDTFAEGQPGRLTHGVMVAESALSEGYRGVLSLRPFLPDDRAIACKAEQAILSGSAPEQRFLRAVQRAAVEGQADMLEQAAIQLKQLKQNGSNHGAVNFSEGQSKARIVEHDYEQLAPAWIPEVDPSLQASALGGRGEYRVVGSSEGQASALGGRGEYRVVGSSEGQASSRQLLRRYAVAFHLDMQKLTSPDPAEHGPERGKLQQALIASVEAAIDGSGRIKTARADYNRAVADLERGRVSVVVAADNQGDLLDKMAIDANGARPRVSADFFENPLSNSRTLTVGAVGSLRDGRGDLPGRRAPIAYYSSPSSQVGVYANGVIGDEDGTSFATPRVAAVVAELHRVKPEASNPEVTRLLLETFCREKVLDASRAALFLEPSGQ